MWQGRSFLSVFVSETRTENRVSAAPRFPFQRIGRIFRRLNLTAHKALRLIHR
jgi:hypothetical protein